MFGIALTRRIVTGVALIYIAGLCWLGEVIVPFTGLAHKAVIFGILLAAGEVFFVAGVAVLGKPLYKDLKNRLTAYIKQTKNR